MHVGEIVMLEKDSGMLTLVIIPHVLLTIELDGRGELTKNTRKNKITEKGLK